MPTASSSRVHKPPSRLESPTVLAREDGSCLLEIRCTTGDVNLPERLGKLKEFIPQRLNNNQPSQLMETRFIFPLWTVLIIPKGRQQQQQNLSSKGDDFEQFGLFFLVFLMLFPPILLGLY